MPAHDAGLWTSVTGPADGERVLLLHGFTQTHRSWDRVAAALTQRGFAVSRVDLPGHGRSGHVSADLWGTANLVASALSAQMPVTIVGYSMGGRVALHVALQHPSLVRRLVVVGATAGIDDPADRRTRRVADDVLATRIVEIGVDAFLAEWLAGPLFSTLTADLADTEDRRANTADGLADSLRRCGTGSQDPLWDRLGEIRCPVTVVVGALDAKFGSLGERIIAAIPRAVAHVVSECGHACHLEDPVAFLRAAFPLD